MSALEASIENLTAEHTSLTHKLEQIDQQYRVDRPGVVSQINQLAKALSALTGKPVAGVSGKAERKPMSPAGRAAIKAGLERWRATKAAAVSQSGTESRLKNSPPEPIKPGADLGAIGKKAAARPN